MKMIKNFIYSILKRSFLARHIIKPFINPTESLVQSVKFKGIFKVNNNDNKSYYLYNNKFYLENSIYWRGIDNFKWELVARKIWIHLSQHSDVIFDIGANTGIYSILSKVYNESSVVYAFEPQPNIFKILKKNIDINKYDINSEKVAISNIIGSLPFYNYGSQTFSEQNTTAGSLSKDWRSNQNNHQSIIVPVIKLNDYIKNNDISRIDLMKIDVETHEYQVLIGMGKYLNQFRPIIIVEVINPNLGLEIDSLFKDINYMYYNIDESGRIVNVEKLGNNRYHNYLLCPKEKLHITKNININ